MRQYYYSDPLCRGLPIDSKMAHELRFMECPLCKMRGGYSMVRLPFFNPVEHGSLSVKKLWRLVNRSKSEPTWADYYKLLGLLREEIGRKDVIIAPCVTMGTASIVVDEEVDVARIDAGAIVIKTSLWQQLQSEGFRLETYEVKARYRRGTAMPEYRELFAPVVAAAHASLEARICEACGRFSSSLVPARFDPSSIPDEIHYFRIRECPNAMLASGDLVNRLKRARTAQQLWKPMANSGNMVFIPG